MKTIFRGLLLLLALSIFIGGSPSILYSSSSSFPLQKKQARKKKISSEKSSSKKKSNSTQSKKYIARGKQRVKQKNYKGALSDFKRAHKMAPSKLTQTYIKKLTPLAKKSASKQVSKKSNLPTKSEVKPISPYKLSESIYDLSNKLNSSTRKMRNARMSLKPIDNKTPEEINHKRLEFLRINALEKPNDRRAQRDMAIQYEREGRFSEAKAIYIRLIASEPEVADHHYFLGSLYTKIGQTSNARFAFREALSLDANHGPTIEALARYGDNLNTKEMAGEIIEELTIQKKPNLQAQLLKEVQSYIESGAFDKVLILANDQSSRFSQSSSLSYMLGQSHEATGDLEAAKEAYKSSMEINQSDTRGGIAIGDIYFNQGNYLYAAIRYEDILSRDPRNIALRNKIGLSYYRAFEWGKAASTWEELLTFAPDHGEVRMLLPEVYYIMSLEYERTGFKDLSRRSFSNALSVNPNSSSWLANSLKTAGEFYRENGMYKLSLRAYQDAMELLPSDIDTYNGLGATYWYMGEKQMAVTAWEKSLSYTSDDNAAKGWLLLANRSLD